MKWRRGHLRGHVGARSASSRAHLLGAPRWDSRRRRCVRQTMILVGQPLVESITKSARRQSATAKHLARKSSTRCIRDALLREHGRLVSTNRIGTSSVSTTVSSESRVVPGDHARPPDRGLMSRVKSVLCLHGPPRSQPGNGGTTTASRRHRRPVVVGAIGGGSGGRSRRGGSGRRPCERADRMARRGRPRNSQRRSRDACRPVRQTGAPGRRLAMSLQRGTAGESSPVTPTDASKRTPRRRSRGARSTGGSPRVEVPPPGSQPRVDEHERHAQPPASRSLRRRDTRAILHEGHLDYRHRLRTRIADVRPHDDDESGQAQQAPGPA